MVLHLAGICEGKAFRKAHTQPPSSQTHLRHGPRGFSFCCIWTKKKMMHKSTEGGTHGKESRTKGSGKGSSGKEGSEESSEGHREEEVIPSFSAPVAGRGGASLSSTTLCDGLKMTVPAHHPPGTELSVPCLCPLCTSIAVRKSDNLRGGQRSVLEVLCWQAAKPTLEDYASPKNLHPLSVIF